MDCGVFSAALYWQGFSLPKSLGKSGAKDTALHTARNTGMRLQCDSGPVANLLVGGVVWRSLVSSFPILVPDQIGEDGVEQSEEKDRDAVAEGRSEKLERSKDHEHGDQAHV